MILKINSTRGHTGSLLVLTMSMPLSVSDDGHQFAADPVQHPVGTETGTRVVTRHGSQDAQPVRLAVPKAGSHMFSKT